MTPVPGSFVTSPPSLVWEDVAEINPENLSVGWEIEARESDTLLGRVVVKGRLKEHISFWRDEIRAPSTIISILGSGYVLPLKQEPTPYVHANHQSASRNSQFVQESISDLYGTGCIEEVSAMSHICSPLSVIQEN